MAQLQVIGTGSPDDPHLEELVHRTIFEETRRLERCQTPYSVRDRAFLDSLREQLSGAATRDPEVLVRQVVKHYLDEIVGGFDAHVYDVAIRLVPPALSLLLHGARVSDPKLFDLSDRIVVDGATDLIARLSALGPVVLVPTHVSHLDAFILGWALHELKLPPFSYGAGLNLYGGPLRRFCMGHLGAYTVDRSKTDPVYRTTLKTYASTLLEHGRHMLFFPGGTRSRSGALESRLKLGLLGTGLEAMRRRLPGNPCSIFFVPCTLSYPLVLEAETLVREYLRNQGGFRYMEPPDEFERLPRWFDLLRALAHLRMRIHVRLGRALDPFGNPVGEDGISRDPSGRAIDPTGYLREGTRIVDDPARDAEYTRVLATKLRQVYRSNVVALPTHAVALAAYSLMRAAHPELDLYRFLQRTQTGTSFGMEELTTRLAQVLAALERAEKRGSLSCSATLKRANPDEVLHAGLDAFSAYHQRCALMQDGDRAHVRASELIFYYQNRIAEHVGGLSSDSDSAAGGAS
jgi:glycerol-3-phosphate O-acyltransferase